jgi:hypothetical protein
MDVTVWKSGSTWEMALFGRFHQEQPVIVLIKDHHIGAPGLRLRFLHNAYPLGFEVNVQRSQVGHIEGDRLRFASDLPIVLPVVIELIDTVAVKQEVPA